MGELGKEDVAAAGRQGWDAAVLVPHEQRAAVRRSAVDVAKRAGAFDDPDDGEGQVPEQGRGGVAASQYLGRDVCKASPQMERGDDPMTDGSQE